MKRTRAIDSVAMVWFANAGCILPKCRQWDERLALRHDGDCGSW